MINILAIVGAITIALMIVGLVLFLTGVLGEFLEKRREAKWAKDKGGKRL